MSKNEGAVHWERLGLKPGATERDIRRAYRAKFFEFEDLTVADPDLEVKKARLEESFQYCLAHSGSKGPVQPESVVASGKEPLSHRKIALRFALLTLAMAGLVLGFRMLQDHFVDPTGGTALATADGIAALEVGERGSKVVYFDPTGKKFAEPGASAESSDSDLAWRPDGNRLMFISNRGGTFEIFRWAPGAGEPEQRTRSSRSKSSLAFGAEKGPDSNDSALVCSGGFVFDFNQRSGALVQLLPPASGRPTSKSDDGEGSRAQMEALYDQIGESFLAAKWGLHRDLVFATMSRDEGEVFVVNPFVQSINDGKPAPVVAAKKIEFDVGAAGQAVVIQRHNQFIDPRDVPSEYLVNGKAVPPVDSAVLLIPPDLSKQFMVAFARGNKWWLGSYSKDRKDPPVLEAKEGTWTFGHPVISPDGNSVVFLLGLALGETGIAGAGLVVVPIGDQEGAQPKILADGPVSDPSWSPDSKKIVFTRRMADGKRGIFVIDTDTGEPRQVAVDADYASPLFSPQVPGSSG